MVQVVSFNQVMAATENLGPILISFYIGSLSDKFGRRRFMAFCFGCKVVASASAANLTGTGDRRQPRAQPAAANMRKLKWSTELVQGGTL